MAGADRGGCARRTRPGFPGSHRARKTVDGALRRAAAEAFGGCGGLEREGRCAFEADGVFRMSAREAVRPGYKRTEVGVIPEDWEVTRVDQIANVKGGKRLPLGRSLTERKTPHPYIRVSDMANGTVTIDAVLFVPEDVFPSIRNYRIFKDDLYISVAGTLGLIGRVPLELDGANLTENADKITDLK